MAIKITQEEFDRKFGGSTPAAPVQDKTVSSRIGEAFTSGAQNIRSGISQSGQDLSTSMQSGDIGGALKATGRGALRTLGGVGKVVGNTIAAPFEKPISEAVGLIGKGLDYAPGLENAIYNNVSKPIVNPLTEKYNQLKQNNPKLAQDIDNALGIANFFGLEAGAQSVGKVATKVGTSAARTAQPVIKAIGSAGKTIGNVTKGFRDVGVNAAESVSKIPGRVATNVAEKQAERAAIQSLPSRTARSAASNGIDAADIKLLYETPKESRDAIKKLTDAAKSFSAGTSKQNPIEAVGNVIVKRVKDLEKNRQSVGSKLGEVSKQLGNVTTNELFYPVYDKVKSIPGLEGIKMGPKGQLDFSETVLATAETAADRKSIQNIFDSATKSGTGSSKHLLRQELFETLGGKKRSLQTLTDTQEKVYGAIRSGLSDVLESKNPQYKSLSNQYRKLMEPLSEMRGHFKKLGGADGDILDMKGGLLARRLTSNSGSNPEIRYLLQKLDKATSIKGKTRLNVETLQDVYNILDKYYDISGKTTLQGQVQRGVEKAAGLGEAAMNTAREFAGVTPAVRRKALEDIVEELTSGTSKKNTASPGLNSVDKTIKRSSSSSPGFLNFGPSKSSGTMDVKSISRRLSNSLQNERIGAREKSLEYFRNNPKEITREPIRLREVDGKIFIEDGRHRLQVAKELGIKKIPIKDVTPEYTGRNSVLLKRR